MCCISTFFKNDSWWVHICWKGAGSMKFTDCPWGQYYSLFVRLAVVIFFTRHHKSFCSWVLREQLSEFLYSVEGRQHFSNRDSIKIIAACVCSTDSNISTTCFKIIGGEEKLCWHPIILLWTTYVRVKRLSPLKRVCMCVVCLCVCVCVCTHTHKHMFNHLH
jgi:hypothetical protein